ncbi:MAG TPA: DUF3696 domain-containing protein [Solirubrobacterales bacterium]|nr:DUF3696 domain-containing protein [Solirubrobacterales bacterium]
MINGDLVRLGRPNDVVRAETDQVAFEFAARVAEADAEDERRWVEYAMRISFCPSEEQLIPHELEVWKQKEALLIAQQASPPKGIQQKDGEALLAVSSEADAGLPQDSWIGVSSFSPHRVVYPADPKLLDEGYHEVVSRATQGDIEAIDSLWSLLVTVEVDEEAPPEISASLSQKLQDARFGPQPASPALTDDERDVLFRFYRESEAPSGWVSEAIGRQSIRRADLIPAWTARKGRNLAPLHRAIALLSDRAGVLASSALYLGPLREDPKVAYPLGHAASSLPVGEKGQFTAAFLEKNKRSKPVYVTPEGQEKRYENLEHAVSRWCQYLEIGQNVTVKSEGKMGHQLTLTLNGQERDMTAIGVGASQLLPVVVLVLGAPPGALILLEQPELHLHPAVQSRLADFFAIARPDLKLLVETHSEYLITRLRRLVADESVKQNRIKVLFAEQTEGVTRFDALQLSKAGDFDHWPTGFFDTLDQEFVELARAITRSAETEDAQ